MGQNEYLKQMFQNQNDMINQNMNTFKKHAYMPDPDSCIKIIS